MLLNVWSVVVVVSQTQESMNLQFLLQGLMWKQSYLRENAGVEGFRPGSSPGRATFSFQS